ncbi:hypothetical protein FHS12_005253, partial [Nocardioides albus]|nr:hypothetical protein [Nocardioides albus]
PSAGAAPPAGGGGVGAPVPPPPPPDGSDVSADVPDVSAAGGQPTKTADALASSGPTGS